MNFNFKTFYYEKKNISLRLTKQKISAVTRQTLNAGKGLTDLDKDCITLEILCGEVCFTTIAW